MSPNLYVAATGEHKTTFLHSPIDDMFSFYFVALAATINNAMDRGTSDDEKNWRAMWGVGADRFLLINAIKKAVLGDGGLEGKAPIVRKMFPLLNDWYADISQLSDGMLREMSRAERTKQSKLLCFDLFAYRGIAKFLSRYKEYIVRPPTSH